MPRAKVAASCGILSNVRLRSEVDSDPILSPTSRAPSLLQFGCYLESSAYFMTSKLPKEIRSYAVACVHMTEVSVNTHPCKISCYWLHNRVSTSLGERRIIQTKCLVDHLHTRSSSSSSSTNSTQNVSVMPREADRVNPAATILGPFVVHGIRIDNERGLPEWF